MEKDKTTNATPIEISKESAIFLQTEERSTILQSLDAAINNADAIETEEERNKRELNEKIESLCVLAEKVYPEEDYLLEIDGVGAFARQDLVAIKAKQKAGKSSMISILIAAMLNGQWGKVKRLTNNQLKIIYIDTEMKERDTNLLYRKALEMAERPALSVENIRFMNLRKLSMEECRTLIPDIIMLKKPDIIFIDGIVDIVGDFNDINLCQSLIREHLALAEEHNCAIVHVLHTNKMAEDHNMRGHLGTMLSQKASNVFECKKDRTLNIVKVECDDYRHEPIPAWYFGFGDNGIPFPADDVAAQYEAEQKELKIQKSAEKKRQEFEKRANTARSIFLGSGSAGIMRSELKAKLMAALGLKDTATNDFINALKDEGLIAPTGFNGTFVWSERKDPKEIV